VKNHSLLIRAIACLPEGIKRLIVYIHVGAELEGCPERKLAEELGVKPYIKFLGSRHDVHNLLCAADVYVMSSLHEGLGISTIEAAFTGREMILTNVQGLRDFGEVVKQGITYCDLTPESMACAIQEKIGVLRQHPQSKSILSGMSSIREDALATFSMKSGVSELVRLYQG
jgi:glycosyltransferase involved in cell wall biosynthesis